MSLKKSQDYQLKFPRLKEATRLALGLLALWLVSNNLVQAEVPLTNGNCVTQWRPAFTYDAVQYPFTHRCAQLGFGNYHYFDEQITTAPRGTVLLVHGNPTWSFLYRDIARELIAQNYRVIAIDHYGFGLSDKPSLTDFGYTPAEHTAVLEDFIQLLDLKDLTLVVQDWGGPIGLGAAGHLPERVKNLLVMSTWAWPIDAVEPGNYFSMRDWSVWNQLNQDYVINTAFTPRETGKMLAVIYGGSGSPIYETIRNAYWSPFINPKTRLPLNPTVATPTSIFARSIVEATAFMTETEQNLSLLTDKPIYLLYGHQDRWLGALKPNPNAALPCPEGTQETVVEGVSYCTRSDTGDFIYPYLENFLARWPAEKVVGSRVSMTADHFIQEYEPAAIVNAINELNAVRVETSPPPLMTVY
ncbi:alpha/beta fold hydrolase [Candidatus Cyanaurora vandensis]|uniref:alpha/beta fold hydrolase n=1 Tax=Candidatus Cyanaurora vandensis TaxID=2714958 RepID=UPI00257AA63A|nr:alpha/beta fold hydrolase [Candidatus Cyanaurora vandensis]